MRKNKRKWICILMLALLFCISAAAVTETRVQAAQTKETTGFVKKKGKTYYYKNGEKAKRAENDRWQQILFQQSNRRDAEEGV